jgi:peptide deformylase
VAVLPIVKEGAAILRQRAKPVERVTKRIEKLVADMFETMHKVDGVGLAAPQVGAPLRVIVIADGERPLVLLNPEIVSSGGQETDLEGCLSIPGRIGYVTRAAEVVVRGADRRGKPAEIKGTGRLARALQHEIDHLDGILFLDRADEVWERKEAEEQA